MFTGKNVRPRSVGPQLSRRVFTSGLTTATFLAPSITSALAQTRPGATFDDDIRRVAAQAEQKLEAAKAALDVVAAADARLELASYYGLAAGTEETWQRALDLMRENSSILLRSRHPPAWGLSRLNFARLCLLANDRLAFDRLTREGARAADDALATMRRYPSESWHGFISYNTSLTFALIQKDLGKARRIFEQAVAEVAIRTPEVLATRIPDDEAAFRGELAKLYALGSLMEAREGNISSAWQWFEASKLLQVDAERLATQFSPSTQDAPRQVADCLKVFSSVVALVCTPAGSNWIAATKRPDGAVNWRTVEVLTRAGAPFDGIETDRLLWGRRPRLTQQPNGGWAAVLALEERIGRHSEGSPFRARLQAFAAEYYSALHDSLEPFWANQPISNAAIIQPADLARLPIRLMISKSPTLNQLAISEFSNLQQAVRCVVGARRSESAKLAGIFNPLSNLPFSELEHGFAKSILSPTNISRIDPSGDGRVVWGRLASSNAPLIWISTHATLAYEDEDRGFSIAGTKRVRLDDVRAMGFRTPPRLVFLSACQTGQYFSLNNQPASGMVRSAASLPAALTSAGATAVIATKWSVDDLSTALVATKTLDGLARNLGGVGQSLQAAISWIRSASAADIMSYCEGASRFLSPNQQAILDDALGAILDSPSPEAPFADPYYWAAFTLIGA